MYPRPDRSDHVPFLRRTDPDTPVDTGWCEGVFADGRPFRAERWRQDDIDVLTVFFSNLDLEHLTQGALRELLANERIVKFHDRAFVTGNEFIDAAGHPLWSVSVVLQERGNVKARTRLEFETYPAHNPS